MRYLIDGHNLIAYLPNIDLDDPNDEPKLVNMLNGFANRDGKHRLEIVFDNGIPGGESRMSKSRVKVFFASSQRTNADTIIKKRIRTIRDRKAWVVVTSDREIRQAAGDHGVRCLSCAEFARVLERPAAPPPIHRGIDPNAHVPKDEVEEYLLEFGEDVPESSEPPPRIKPKFRRDDGTISDTPDNGEKATPAAKRQEEKRRRHPDSHLSEDEWNQFLESAGEAKLGEEPPPTTEVQSKRFRKPENRRRTHLPRDMFKDAEDSPPPGEDPYLPQDDIEAWRRAWGDED